MTLGRAAKAGAKVAAWGALFFVASFLGQLAALYAAVSLVIWRYAAIAAGLPS